MINPSRYNPNRRQWQVTSVRLITADEERAIELLTDGWEPFAVNGEDLWLRRDFYLYQIDRGAYS